MRRACGAVLTIAFLFSSLVLIPAVAAQTATVPSEPYAARMFANHSTITVLWGAPDDSSASSVTKYRVQWRNLTASEGWPTGNDFGDAHRQVEITDLSNLWYRITGLTSGADYHARVAAVSDDGMGPWAESSNFSDFGKLRAPDTVSTLSMPPTDFTLAPGDGTITATWGAPSDGGGGESDSYRLEWQELNGAGEPVDLTDLEDRISSLSHTISGLTNGTSYRVRVAAFHTRLNAGRFTPWLSASPTDAASPPSVTYSAPADPSPSVAPQPPDTYRSAGGHGVGIVWWYEPPDTDTVPGDGGSPVTSYTLQWKTGTDAWPTGSSYGIADRQVRIDVPASLVDSQAGSVLDYLIPGLDDGAAYTVRVAATNSAGQSDSDEQTIRLRSHPPSEPREFCLEVNDGGISVLWDAPVDRGGDRVTGYDVSWKPLGAAGYQDQDRDSVSGSSTQHTIDSTSEMLVTGESYAVRVRAKNRYGACRHVDELTIAYETGAKAGTCPTAPPSTSPTTSNRDVRQIPAPQNLRPTITRFSGPDRYATSLAIARRVARDTSGSTVVLVSGESWADAMAAAGLAGRLRASIVLVPKDGLGSDALKFLSQTGARRVVVGGGEAAVLASTLAGLSPGVTVERVSGSDRYATSAAAARRLGSGGWLRGFGRVAFVISGVSHEHGISIGPVAARGGHPVLLTRSDRLHPDVEAYLASGAVTHAILVGNEAAVDAGTAQTIADLGLQVTRLAGTDPYATAIAVAKFAIGGSEAGPGAQCHGTPVVGLAALASSMDALSAAPMLGKSCAPLLLSSPEGLTQATKKYLLALIREYGVAVHVIGGQAAIPASVVASFR